MLVKITFLLLKTYLIVFVYNLVSAIYHFVRSRMMNKKVMNKIKDKWILITGATDGIGKSISIELSKRKYNLIIVGRNQERIDAVKEIVTNNGAKCQSLLIDFSLENDFHSLVSEYDIGLLINNVGCCSNGPTFFTEDDQMENIINVNITNTFKLTKVVLNKMLECKTGYIVNVGSITGDFSVPFLSTYASSKAMIRAWSESLNSEVKPLGLNVECMNTGYVCTKMSRIRKSSIFWPTPETYAKCVVSHLGSNDLSYAYFPHLLQAICLQMTPKIILNKMVYLSQNAMRCKANKKKNK